MDKAVLLSDVHYNLSNLELADNATNQAIKYAESNNLPLVITGDLHDTKSQMNGKVVQKMIQTFKNRKCRIVIIPGNHCRLHEKSEEHSLEFLKPYVEVIDKSTYDPMLGAQLIPYQHDVKEMERILSSLIGVSLLYIHQGITGANMGDYVQDKSAVDKKLFANFRTISGHYHRHQDIRCGRPQRNAVGLFTYVGNPYTLSFGEANDGPKGFCVLKDNGLLELIPTNLRKHIVAERELANLYDSAVAGYNPGDEVAIKVKGPASELDKLDKQDVGARLLGHCNFRLDKIPTDNRVSEMRHLETKDEGTLLDALIDAKAETEDQKKYLKQLWRDTSDDLS